MLQTLIEKQDILLKSWVCYREVIAKKDLKNSATG